MDFLGHLAAVLIFGLGLLLADASTGVNSYNGYIVEREYDICRPLTNVTNPNSIYLPTIESSTEVFLDTRSIGSQRANINCLLYIKTCDDCRIAVEHAGSFDYPACPKSIPPDGDTSDVCIPDCAYFYLFDADYKSQTTKVFSSSPVSYRSESKQLHIIACGMNYNQTIKMRLKLTVQEKLTRITYSRASPYPQQFGFSSPFFPSPFAKNREEYTYRLESREPNMIAVVSFDDWMLTPTSYLTFYSAIGETMVMGSQDRPLIKSTGPNLTVSFYTGEPISGQSSFLGFKAKVAFISGSVNVIKPSTACDQDISSEGGIIRLTIPDGQLKDCIFVIRKISRFDGVYLRVLKTQSDGQHDMLEYKFDIYSGITSMGEWKGRFQRNDPVQNSSVFVSSDGFYIRYVGQYYDGSTHLLAYAMFKDGCDDFGGYFRCRNDRCIALALKCDGCDHCGDGSDEYSSLCTYATTHSNSSYPLSIGIIIPVVVSLFLIIVVCVLVIFIRRCRKLNNEVRARRPPGLRSNRQRMRHNRDVQMSVTLRSGEHPPSYDEVLQSTPIGYLNMAFTWSQHGNNMAQPPSYEEAVSPTSQQNGNIIITATANSGHGEATRTSHQNSSAVLTTTISASLDPRAEVSSSSSSEDVPDQFRQFDSSSSSESSVENEHRLTSNGLIIDSSRSNMNLTKRNKELAQDAGSQRSSPKYSNNEESAQVILGSLGFVKVNSNGQERATPVLNKRIEESDSSRRENNAGREQLNVTDIRDQQRSSGDLRNVSAGRQGHRLLPTERFVDKSGGAQSHVLSGSEGFRDAERESKQGRARTDMYQKNKGKHSHQNVDRENVGDQHPGAPSDGWEKHLPKVTDTSRSQSCFDLSLGAGSARLLDGSGARVREEDKRFSYAGVGDTSLARDSLDHFNNGRGLIRERPREHLDRYATQSYENIRDGTTIRTHDKLGYEGGSEQDGLQQHRQNRSSNSPGYFPKSSRDKIDAQRVRGQYSNLPPVKEHLHGEAHLPVSKTEATHRNLYSGHTDDQLDYSPADNCWSQHRRNPLESARASTQANSDSSQKTHTQSRGSSHEHLLPGSSRSLPSDRTAAAPSHNYVNRHDHRKPSSIERSRQQAELQSSRGNVGDFQNLNANNSSNNAAHSDMQGEAQHSTSSGSVPQSDPDTAASMFKPKPSLRKSRMKAAQHPDRHTTESSQGPMQASHRPVPAPRQGIRKQESADDRGPLPAAPNSRSMQGTSRSRSEQNVREDEGSLPVTDLIQSRDHIKVEATSDDVFV